jgi:hypothetical protein
MIVSAQAKGSVGGGTDVPVLVMRRNEVAVDCLRRAIATDGVHRIGLLYGGLHMPGGEGGERGEGVCVLRFSTGDCLCQAGKGRGEFRV